MDILGKINQFFFWAKTFGDAIFSRNDKALESFCNKNVPETTVALAIAAS